MGSSGGYDYVNKEVDVSEANFLMSEANTIVSDGNTLASEASKLSAGARICRGPGVLEFLVLSQNNPKNLDVMNFFMLPCGTHG